MGADGAELTTVRSLVPPGDSAAFLALVERHYRNMYRLAFRMTCNEHDAKDVVQESWFRAWKRLSDFEGRADLGTWLHRIVANCAVDLLRARRSRLDRSQLDGHSDQLAATTSPDPERLATSAEAGRHIASALESLSPIERAAFTLRHFEGYSIDEIARSLGLRHNNVKQQIFRAIRKLRVALEAQRSTL